MPTGLLGAVFWPITVWTSVSHFEQHAADDYVERTSPIAGTAIAFWLCVAALIVLQLVFGAAFNVGGEDGGAAVRVTRVMPEVSGVLWFFLPIIYIAGFWMMQSRTEEYPKG
ncbi:hypothetical protein [Terricaulis sp.]|uniref:hypothetical protein n=1 Tax=Terricaulis sp. TaxID=2768686 RepID=UPI003784F6E0